MKLITKLASLVFFSTSLPLLAQLDSKHFIPPIYYGLAEGGSDTGNFDRHYLVLSTPSQDDVTVTVKDGADNVLIDAVISNDTPLVHILGRLSSTGVYRNTHATGTGNVIGTSKLNQATTDGLIIEASAPVYANIRHQSGYQGASLTSKGRPALGSEFRVATMRNNDVLAHNYRSLFFSLMAVEDNTVVEIDQIKSGVVFTNTTASGNPVTSESVTITLQKGESYVVGIKNDLYAAQGGTATLNDVNGTRVRSSKPIAMNSGTVLGCPDRNNYGSRDMGFDQIAPVTRAGSEYLLVKGGGTNGSDLETVIVVATADDTNIFTQDSLSPLNAAPLNAGEYAFVTGQYDDNGNLYLKSDQPTLVWQTVAGTNSPATPGLNFVPPLNKDIATSVNNIAEINLIGDATLKIVGRTGHPVTINGNAPETGPTPVVGTDEWVVYTQANLSGNPKVESTSAIAVSLAILKNPIGAAAYYSGYPEFKPLIEATTRCAHTIPGAKLKAVDPSGSVYESYEWFNSNGTSTGITGEQFTPTEPGNYYVLATSGSNIAGDAISAPYEIKAAAVADLAIDITVDQNEISSGDLVNFTLTVTNNGSETAEMAQVTCVLPEGFTYNEGSIYGGEQQSEALPSTYGLKWNLETLSAEIGQNTTTLGFAAQLNGSGGVITASAISSCANDSDLANNSSSVEPTRLTVIDPDEDCCDRETFVEFNIRDLDTLSTHGVRPENYDAARNVWHQVRDLLHCTEEGTPLEVEKQGFLEDDFLITEDSEVIVTVIYDGGNSYNTIAHYDANDPENTWRTIWESYVTGPLAPLIPGSASSLGIIPAGTNLRLGLIMDGARGGTQKIYQDAHLNVNGAVRTASKLLLEDENRPLIVAFEDRLDPNSDNDFNDVIIKIDIIPTSLGTAQHDNVIQGQLGQNSDRGSRGVKALLENYGMNEPEMEFTAEYFEIPASMTQLTFDLIDDRGPMKFILAAVDYSIVSGMNPASLEFRKIAAENAVTLLDDRNVNVGDSVTINPKELGLAGKEILFLIIPNNTVSTYLRNPWRYTAKGNGNRTKRQPLFSLNNANPESKDQFLVFSDGYSTLLTIEDYSRTEDTVEVGDLSNDSFDDIQVQIRPALTPLSFHNGTYHDGSPDPTIGFTGPDGYTEKQHGGY